jgi:hypothetical protein
MGVFLTFFLLIDFTQTISFLGIFSSKKVNKNIRGGVKKLCGGGLPETNSFFYTLHVVNNFPW